MFSALFTIVCTALLISAKVAAKASNSTGPQKLGVLLFPGWEYMDVFGPLEVFDTVSESQHLDLYIISSSLNASLDPVSNLPPHWHPEKNKFNSTVSVSVVPTHTLAAPPDDLEVLLVPGGLGTSVPDSELTSIFVYIAEVYPKLHSLISPCTGVSLVARSGVLDGRNATTNKQLWAENTATRPQVNWKPGPRWVQDGNIWTAGGISAATDVAFAWLAGTFGEELARATANDIEYEWRNDANWDVFAYVWGALTPGAA